MAATQVFPSGRQFLLLGKETTPGTPVTGTATLVVEEFKPRDVPVWLDDKGWHGSMAEVYGRQEGVVKTDFTMKGACFADTLPYLLSNILGDIAYTGGTNSGSSTTTTSTITAGQTTAFTVTSGTGIIVGTVLAIGTGATLELITAATGTSGTSVVPTGPFVFAHSSGATVQPVTGPFNNAFSLLNTGTAQPSTLTLTHYLGPTATVQARAYAGACLSELNLRWNAETLLFEYDAKGSCWPSVPAAAVPTQNPSTVTPVASWRANLGVGGPASGGTLIKYLSDGEINIKRMLDVVFTAQGSQSPYVIVRGTLTVGGKLNFVAVPDESQLLNMLNNSQPQVQLVIDNGQSGTNHALFQFDSQLTSYKDFVPEVSKAAVGYQGSFDSIANTTNAGVSAGYSPGKVTVLNNVAPQAY